MADHYVALNQGINGLRYNDFVTGTANTVGVNQIELRVQDGAGLSKKDILIALKAFERFFENAQVVGPAGFSVSG